MVERRKFLKLLSAVSVGALYLDVTISAGLNNSNRTRLPRLKVFNDPQHPNNKRYIVTEDGLPFFYLGDTAWELFHRLSLEEVELYFQDRAAKGFTVIQAVVLAELDGLGTPNAYGQYPLHGNDPTKPNEEYFKFVDKVVEKAEAFGLYIGMLPTWGDKVNKKWGIGPEIFSPENARIYGEFLGKRYRNKPIIWILGGDRPIENERHLAIWRAMAKGLREGDNGEHLITYHPMGGQSSSQWLHEEEWLDFNMIQSGHGARHIPNYEMIQQDYNRRPIKPCMDGEARYENHPINWNPSLGWFDDFDVREAAYWATLAGAHGHTYGCHDIWQFYDPQKGHKPISHARTPWQEAIKLPGSFQMQWLKKLLLSRPMLLRIPDQSLIASDAGSGAGHIRAARAIDGSYAFIYLPQPRPVTIRFDKLNGRTIKSWWYDPRTGKTKFIEEFNRNSERTFNPPNEGKDWVLVLDEGSKDFQPPGELL